MVLHIATVVGLRLTELAASLFVGQEFVHRLYTELLHHSIDSSSADRLEEAFRLGNGDRTAVLKLHQHLTGTEV